MKTDDFAPTLASLFGELADGPSAAGAFILNTGDPGLLNALDGIDAGTASRSSAGGASIAAHVAHLQYGLSLMNRWASGENPFAEADWSAAWRTGAVTATQWAELRSGLRAEAVRWRSALRQQREVTELELSGMIGSVAHFAYHLGALRQIEPTLRGPREADPRPGPQSGVIS